MCGIAGLIVPNYSVDQIKQMGQRMQAAIQHRGPDDQGIYLAPTQQTALIHTRLSILDLSTAGHQPMSTPDGRYWISFNGEIYNFRQLKAELEHQGDRFQSQTDTEVLLRLYQRDGEACVNSLRGMFAFAIWDEWEQTCFIARDPLGIKPLYYWQSGNKLVFASELKAVLASGLPSRSLNPTGLYGYLTTGSVPEPHTLLEDIYCLPAGHTLLWQRGETTTNHYWQIQFGAESIAPETAIEQVRAALIDSVRHHFVSDVPVGVFLSGGIDSTAVVALSRQIQSGELRTYSIGFEESDWSESTIAHQVAQEFETEHTEWILDGATARSLLPKFLSAIDQPSIDGFNTFCVSHLTQLNGTKVVLSGLGGDELFNGYNSSEKVPQLVDFATRLQPIKPLVSAIGAGLEQWTGSGRYRRLGDFLQRPATLANAYRSFRGIFTHTEACQISQSYTGQSMPRRDASTVIPEQPSTTDVISWLELTQYMRNQLLRESDVMSMTWGLELRVPFVDATLLDAIAQIPSDIRLQPGKQLLTQAVPEVPTWVRDRPKQGFYFPFQVWMDGAWKDYFQAVDCPKSIPLKNWYRRWSLAVLQHWWQQI
ncbi:asparagine synthase [Leptolyngbya sp. NIES-3755]|nr:asparagine synthase [Leptolyngbya sp. NIES-3755]